MKIKYSAGFLIKTKEDLEKVKIIIKELKNIKIIVSVSDNSVSINKLSGKICKSYNRATLLKYKVQYLKFEVFMFRSTEEVLNDFFTYLREE